MSYVFELSGVTVWSPSLNTGTLFVDFADAMGRVFGLETGLRANAADMYYIEPAPFEAFTQAIFKRYFSTSNPEFLALLRGPLVISLAVLERGGVTLQAIGADQENLLLEAHERSIRLPA